MPMTVETEPLDVAVATEAVDEAATLRIHDDEASDDVADVAETNPETTLLDEPIDDEDPEAPAIDYDDAIASIAAEQAEAAATAETTTTNTATPVAVRVAKPVTRSSEGETLAKISEAAEEVREWREKLALLKDEAKEAKENLQGAINRLMRLSSEVANDATRPLLAAAETKVESTTAAPPPSVDTVAAGDESQTQPELAPSPAAPSTESWRAYRFDDPDHFPALAAQKAIVAKLAENSPPINTIGDLLDFQKPVGDYSKGLTDIKGIGTGKAEKIENSLEQFWADHPELVQEAVDAS